ncbi:hypothetical protein [Xanthomonas citri]|uniref:hypothetical protein n=1 Tax=Xanthomonas citri TaxID=346 RepID=UPI000B5CC8A4|nr:hypothetical protein [Xanthomonas citri]ASL00341.1 hypothetical protein XcvCFBP7113P_08020 [Xanthomonas citri pv. vignicola]
MDSDLGFWVYLEYLLRLRSQPLIHFLCARQAGAAGGAIERPRQEVVLGAGTFDVFEIDTLYACVL